MNQPYPGWNQQPHQQPGPYQQHQQQYQQQTPYGGQPGYPPQQGYGPPGYPYPYGGPPPQGTAMAYVAAALFLPAIVYTYIVAFFGMDTSNVTGEGTAQFFSSLPGLAFSEDATGNQDFAIALSFSLASTALALALALCFRLGFVRWILAGLSIIAVGYYVYHVIWIFTDGDGSLAGLSFVALGLWLIPSVVVLLPATGKAMRGYRPRGPVVSPYPY